MDTASTRTISACGVDRGYRACPLAPFPHNDRVWSLMNRLRVLALAVTAAAGIILSPSNAWAQG